MLLNFPASVDAGQGYRRNQTRHSTHACASSAVPSRDAGENGSQRIPTRTVTKEKETGKEKNSRNSQSNSDDTWLHRSPAEN